MIENVSIFFFPKINSALQGPSTKYCTWLIGCWLISLTHWGRVTHICISKLTTIGLDNGLLPDWHQAIIWTNGGILLIRPLGTNFSEILIGILTFSFKKMRLKVSSAKWWLFCLSLKSVVSEMVAILSRPQCVNRLMGQCKQDVRYISHKICIM